MIRTTLWTLLFIFLFITEVSFIKSLPAPIAFAPLVFALTTYIVQHIGVHHLVIWIPVYGALLDILHINRVPLSFVTYAVASIAIYWTAKHLLSNRSYYGVIACGAIGYFGLVVMEIATLFVYGFFSASIDWSNYAQFTLWQGVALLSLMTIFYPFANNLKNLLVELSLIDSQAKTF